MEEYAVKKSRFPKAATFAHISILPESKKAKILMRTNDFDTDR
jgi:hypothetical protein